MNYMADFNSISDKLGALLLDNGFMYKFHTVSYPMMLVIYPDTDPTTQMALYTVSDDGATSSDARLVFTFPVGEIGIKVSGRLVMPDALLNKVKGMAKKMHKAYLEGLFAQSMSNEPAPAVDPASEPEAQDFDEFFEADDEDEN